MSDDLDMKRQEYRLHLQKRLVESEVPAHLHHGLIEYVAMRRPVGHFLTAVLSNDLKEACGRADQEVKPKLANIIFFLYNYAPSNCWGSSERVAEWLTAKESPPMVFD